MLPTLDQPVPVVKTSLDLEEEIAQGFVSCNLRPPQRHEVNAGKIRPGADRTGALETSALDRISRDLVLAPARIAERARCGAEDSAYVLPACLLYTSDAADE